MQENENPAPASLRGRPPAWTRTQAWLLFFLVCAGLLLRLSALGVEGFADDEVHKWVAANRYLGGVFVFDDELEHPMLMKSLIALSISAFGRLGFSPEVLTRLPNALGAGLSIWLTGLLGRRLYGASAGLIAAGLAAFSTTLIGYQLIAKEDTLLGVFLLMLVHCCAQAHAAAEDGNERAQRRWELLGAASMGLMFATKYFIWLALIPLFAYLWLRPISRWRISVRRWALLVGVSFAVFAVLNWSVLLPSTWLYVGSYFHEKKTVHGALFFMGRVYHNLPSWWLQGTPTWFYVVFAAVKFAPLTVLAWVAGFAIALRRRAAADRLLLSWVGVAFFAITISGSKWGRFFTSLIPAFLLLAALAASSLLSWARARSLKVGTSALAPAALAAVLLVAGEAAAAVKHAPYYRLYVNAFGGGDRNVDFFFPHCDYFDTGFRAAIEKIARSAPPGAQIATEVEWPARYYLERLGRPDLKISPLRRGEACREHRECYAIVETGRWYFQNQAAVDRLSRLEPWFTVRAGRQVAVQVYQLLPGDSPFPGTGDAKDPLAATSIPWPPTVR